MVLELSSIALSSSFIAAGQGNVVFQGGYSDWKRQMHALLGAQLSYGDTFTQSISWECDDDALMCTNVVVGLLVSPFLKG